MRDEERVLTLAPGPPVARLAGLLAATMALAVLVFPTFGALSAFLVDDLGLSRTQFGWLPSGAAFSTAAFALMGGRKADAWGGRRAVVRLLLVTGMVGAGLASASGYPMLLAFAVLAGVPNALANPATNKLVADHLPIGTRGAVMGVKQSGVQAGMFIAGLVFPTLAVLLGWRAVFGVIAVAAVGLGIACNVLLPAIASGPALESTGASQSYRAGRDHRMLAAYALCMGIGGASVTSFVALYAVEALGVMPTLAGTTVALVGVVGIASRITVGGLVERRGMAYPPTLAALSFGAAGTILVLLAAPVVGAWLVWVGAALAGVTVMAWNAVANLAAVATVPRRHAGRASAVVNMGFMTGLAVGPIAFGMTADASGSYVAAWSLAMAAFVVGALVALRWWRPVLSKRTGATP